MATLFKLPPNTTFPPCSVWASGFACSMIVHLVGWGGKLSHSRKLMCFTAPYISSFLFAFPLYVCDDTGTEWFRDYAQDTIVPSFLGVVLPVPVSGATHGGEQWAHNITNYPFCDRKTTHHTHTHTMGEGWGCGASSMGATGIEMRKHLLFLPPNVCPLLVL